MPKLIEVDCPQCRSRLWIDVESGQVVEHKKTTRRDPADFSDLLQKEKEKKEKADQRFAQARELEQAKKEKAKRLFEQQIKDSTGKS